MKNKSGPKNLPEEFAGEPQPQDEAKPLSELHPGEAAEVLQNLPAAEQAEALLNLEPPKAADILESLPDDRAAAAIMDMAPEDASAIVQEMQTDEQVDLLQDVSEEHAESILEQIDEKDAQVARKLLEYAEDTAGGLMQREYIPIYKEKNAKEVILHLQVESEKYKDYPATYLYVVDGKGRLNGVVSMRSLLLNKPGATVKELTNTEFVSVPASMPGQELVKVFRKYHYLAVPVLDEEGVLLGVVTEDDAMRFAEEEADEELLRFSGIVKGDEFRDMPFFPRSWRRLSWLSINIILNCVAASVIAYYQDTLQAVIALAVFLPIISDMSGCSGNQAVAVSIRELSLDRIRPGNFLWVLGKEASIGLLNGLALGTIIGLIAFAWKGSVLLGAIVGAALWINTIVAVSIGGMTPLLLRSINQDPAIASSPILTTLTDMCGFFVLLTLATKYVHLLPQ